MKDKTMGGLLLGASIIGIFVYGYLMFLAPESWQVWAIRITLFAAVGGILSILAWIGYTLASTPPPEPIPELEKSLTEQKGLEKETK
ncbi:MAG: dolichol phosphate-mannose biosynthesis regulatory protein [Aigarchaeota archaeon]|nr:dolichol phosphate-mannose biosynthesis regulatory protein [Aigarchaeota archaeon]MDW8093195.1 transcriptional regulator [Nitrososphaerota archaeon]